MKIRLHKKQEALVFCSIQKYEIRVGEKHDTLRGFCVWVSHNGKVDKQMAGMAYLAHSFDSSGELEITCREACNFFSM